MIRQNVKGAFTPVYQGLPQTMKFSPEEILQRDCIQFLETMCPTVLFWHIPNENKLLSVLPSSIRRFALLRKMRLLGVRAGVPDLVLHWHGSATLYVELKVGKNKRTEKQVEIHGQLLCRGFPIEVVRSLDEFIAVCEKQGVPMRSGIYSGRIINRPQSNP